MQRPRLRDKRGHEVHVPAYERLRDDAGMGQRVRDILVAGVSTRRYAAVLPQAAGTVGVSKSAVSRRFVEASAEQLAALNERDLKNLKLLVIYIEGIVVAGHHILAAIGVDEAGDKQLLGLAPGASENAQVAKDLLRGLIERGLDATASYLFVIDGSKALRSAIDEMFGQRAHVQRWRTHKLRNVLERLPKTEAAQTKAVMMAAYKLAPKDGMAKMKIQAEWLQREHPDAAASLREGFQETFTVNTLGLPPSLTRCLCTTNIIDEPERHRAAHERSCDALPRRRHGAALDGSRVPPSAEVVPQDPGHQGLVDTQGCVAPARRANVRRSSTKGRLTCIAPPPRVATIGGTSPISGLIRRDLDR